MEDTPLDLITLREVCDRIMTAVDTIADPLWVALMAEHVESDHHGEAHLDSMRMLFPVPGTNNIDDVKLGRMLDARSQVTFHMLAAATFDTIHSVRPTLHDLGNEFAVQLSGKDSIHTEPGDRSTFWTSLWGALAQIPSNAANVEVAALQALNNANALASGDLAALVAAQHAHEQDRQVVSADVEMPTAPDIMHSVDIGSGDSFNDWATFLGAKLSAEATATDAGKPPQAGPQPEADRREETDDLLMIRHLISSAFAVNAVKTHRAGSNIGNLTFSEPMDPQSEGSSSLRVDKLESDMKLPFWGRVVFKNQLKSQPRLSVGSVHGTDVFLIPDDDDPCPAWGCQISQEKDDYNVELVSSIIDVKVPFKKPKEMDSSESQPTDESAESQVSRPSKGAKKVTHKVMQFTAYHLQPTAACVGMKDRVLCRANSATDRKNIRKASEVAVTFVKRRLSEMKLDNAGVAAGTSEPVNKKRGKKQPPTDGDNECETVLSKSVKHILS